MNASSETSVTKEKLIDDLRILAQDAQELLKTFTNDFRSRSRDRFNTAFEAAKSTGRKISSTAREKAAQTDMIVRQKPYHTLGIAFVAGVALGYLLRPHND